MDKHVPEFAWSNSKLGTQRSRATHRHQRRSPDGMLVHGGSVVKIAASGM
jgi:hypothetical protein